MAILTANQKEFELPPSRQYYARIIDVIEYYRDLPKYNKTNVPHLTVVWVLNANDSEGRPFRATVHCTRNSIHEKTTLYKIASAILGTAPPVPFDTESLMNRASLLFIQQERSSDGKNYSNIKAIMPVMPEQMQYVPNAPAGFVRDKDKPAAEQKNAKIKQSNRTFAANSAPAPVAAVSASQPTAYVPPQPNVPAATGAPQVEPKSVF